jgi:hypothetical protein
MMLLSPIIQTFEADFLATYQDVLPSQLKALATMKQCRTTQSPVMLAQCDDCEHQCFIPHSCGHRSCPHCQHYESEQWLQRQLKKQVPAEYFLLTFTLPAEFRSLAWQHQHTLYELMIRCSWETLKTFTRNDPQLQGDAGAISVLHTHSRRLDYHPHVHVVMPAAAIDTEKQLWRTKKSKGEHTSYLFNHKALAKVFRAKLLEAIREAGLELPDRYPETWVVDCKSVGSGDKALVYLSRYLYKGVIQEKDIIACKDGQVTFRYQDSKIKNWQTRTLSGPKFLWLILQHVLPKGFRRTRNFGFLHPNSKRLLGLLRNLLKLNPVKALPGLLKRPPTQCPCCGGAMRIVQTRIPRPAFGLLVPSASG